MHNKPNRCDWSRAHSFCVGEQKKERDGNWWNENTAKIGNRNTVIHVIHGGVHCTHSLRWIEAENPVLSNNGADDDAADDIRWHRPPDSGKRSDSSPAKSEPNFDFIFTSDRSLNNFLGSRTATTHANTGKLIPKKNKMAKWRTRNNVQKRR